MRYRKKQDPISSEDNVFFHEFYENHKNFLFYIARRYASTQTDCEDIVQDSILRLMANIPTLKQLDRSKAAKYLALTVRTAYLDIEKRKHGEDAVYLDDASIEALLKAECVNDDGISGISARMEVARLRQSLSARDWLVLEGKYILGLSQEEIGAQIGVSPNSVRMILSRARDNARKILSDEEQIGGGNNA
ncbi:MAG: sigma-70 family RNA polymerase sigma factor [Oscillospiraceae bacterium]|nr:sigma-70 family RNA polymerase sigma factor [Oscillospiraceae bacterium]